MGRSLWKKGAIYFLCIVLGLAFWTAEGICVNAKKPTRKGAIPLGLELASNSKPLKELTSGACGENITWTYDKTSKTLEFSGTGAIYDTEGAAHDYGLIGSWSVWHEEADYLIIGEGITEIGEANFYKFYNLKSISFPDTLVKIGDYAFSYSFYNYPISIVFPTNLKSIGSHAFEADSDYSKIVGITLPYGLERLGEYVFNWQPIREAVIPGTIHFMDDGVFSYCDKLEKLTLEGGVEMIPFRLCEGCRNLKTVEIPNTVKEIRAEAFTGCEKLKNIKIPEKVQSIEDSTFSNCSSLTNITISDGVTSIGVEAFYCCSSLTSITMPDSVTSIKVRAFWGCSHLTSITIPDRVTSIKEWTFSRCSKLTSITIPDSVTSIRKCAFSNCSSLTNITIPDGVTSIGESAFEGAGITKITIPNTVKTLGRDVFSECSKLKQVKLPAHLSEIKSGLFMNCKKLEYVEIPQTVTSVTLSAFWGTGVKKIVLPKNVTSLKKDFDPFPEYNTVLRKARMTKLRQIVIQSTKLKKVSKGAFSGINKTCVIKVPKKKVKKYKTMIYESGVDKKVKIKAIAKSK